MINNELHELSFDDNGYCLEDYWNDWCEAVYLKRSQDEIDELEKKYYEEYRKISVTTYE